jgi:hypothetical protein
LPSKQKARVSLFQLPSPLSGQARRRLITALCLLPRAEGKPIRISLLPALHAHRGGLLSEKTAGSAVHAGTFLRKRRIILDSELLEQPKELARILVHEVFHFVWMRLGNATRRSYEKLVETEIRRRARGELGWSAEWRKQALSASDLRDRSRRWREYICESFCDSAAWFFLRAPRHGEFTLAPAFRRLRRGWFRDARVAVGIQV